MIGLKKKVSGCSISDDLIHMISKEMALLHSMIFSEMRVTLSCPSSRDSTLDSGLRQDDQYYRSLRKYGCVCVSV